MTALNIFLFGMPVVLIVGTGVTVWFARRAAASMRTAETIEVRVGPNGKVLKKGSQKPTRMVNRSGERIV